MPSNAASDMKIGVIGGGIFGVTIAWLLAKHGYRVDLFEKETDILQAASSLNQLRFHRGYHYPRSKETIQSCIMSHASFMREYKDAVIGGGSIKYYYCVSKENSLTSANECSEIWKEFNLEHEQVDIDIIKKDKVEKIFEVKESSLDPVRLKRICRANLEKYKVNVMLNRTAGEDDLKNYDLAIIATYAMNNSLLKHIPQTQREYQFELCEKLVLKLGDKFRNKSMVILDGPFMCIDPYGASGLFLMGNVVHAIHNKNIGKYPEIPKEFINLLNKGVIKNPPVTNFKKFIEAASVFFHGIEEVKHIGSMFTFRTVLPKREYDDARPTLINKVTDNIYSVLSGKIGACVDTAEDVLKIADNMGKKI